MKYLFFLLALANVALFMWEYKTGALAPVTTTSSQKIAFNQEPILLVSELKNLTPPVQPAAITQTASAEPIVAETKTTAMRCYEVGAFTKPAQSRQWLNQFSEAGAVTELVKKNEQIPNKYMVYYPAAQTPAQSEANLQMLKKRGINDLFMLRTEKDQGDISLGVFSKEERALTMKNQLLAQGMNVNIKILYTTKVRQYAFIKSENPITEQLDALQKSSPQLTVKEVLPCN